MSICVVEMEKAAIAWSSSQTLLRVWLSGLRVSFAKAITLWP